MAKFQHYKLYTILPEKSELLYDKEIKKKAQSAAAAEQSRRQQLADDAKSMFNDHLTEEQREYFLHPEKIKVDAPFYYS